MQQVLELQEMETEYDRTQAIVEPNSITSLIYCMSNVTAW